MWWKREKEKDEKEGKKEEERREREKKEKWKFHQKNTKSIKLTKITTIQFTNGSNLMSFWGASPQFVLTPPPGKSGLCPPQATNLCYAPSRNEAFPFKIAMRGTYIMALIIREKKTKKHKITTIHTSPSFFWPVKAFFYWCTLIQVIYILATFSGPLIIYLSNESYKNSKNNYCLGFNIKHFTFICMNKKTLHLHNKKNHCLMYVRNDENIYSVCNCAISNNHYLGKICKKIWPFCVMGLAFVMD